MACVLFLTKTSASNERNWRLQFLVHSENLCLFSNAAIQMLGLVLLLPPHSLLCGLSSSSVTPMASPYQLSHSCRLVCIHTHGKKRLLAQWGIHTVKVGEMIELALLRNKDTDTETKNPWKYMGENQGSHSFGL